MCFGAAWEKMKNSHKSQNFSFARMVQSSIDYQRGYYAENSLRAVSKAICDRQRQDECADCRASKRAASRPARETPCEQRAGAGADVQRPLSGLFNVKSFIAPGQVQEFTPTDSFRASPVGVFSKEFAEFQRERKFQRAVRKNTGFVYGPLPREEFKMTSK